MENKTVKKTERTPKQTAAHVSYAIAMISKVVEAVPVMKNYDFFDIGKFKESGFDLLIKNVCERYDVDEKHIRTVGEFTKDCLT